MMTSASEMNLINFIKCPTKDRFSLFVILILILRFGFIRDQLFSLNSLKQEHEDISVGLKNRPTFRLSKLNAIYSDKFVFKQMPHNPERSRKISSICI